MPAGRAPAGGALVEKLSGVGVGDRPSPFGFVLLFGHPAGDTVLQALVLRCQSVVRENDLLGRIGGEEFAILLPDTEAGSLFLLL